VLLSISFCTSRQSNTLTKAPKRLDLDRLSDLLTHISEVNVTGLVTGGPGVVVGENPV
jgi:hypothetical protein